MAAGFATPIPIGVLGMLGGSAAVTPTDAWVIHRVSASVDRALAADLQHEVTAVIVSAAAAVIGD